MIHNSKIAFFGSSEFSVHVLNELKLHYIVPNLIITTPDKPKGRKLTLTPTPVKIWAQENNIEVITPEKLRDNSELISYLISHDSDLFLVASYGKIIPKEIFEIPEHKTLNIHPSLLPKYRGASPIQSQILNNEKEVGVTVIEINEEMDAGPLVAQRQFPISNPPAGWAGFQFPNSDSISNSQFSIPSRKELEKYLAVEGARLFAHILPEWLSGAIDPIMQNEKKATYCQKIEKKEGEINLDNDPYKNFLKIQAFEDWPGTYFFKNGKRIKITAAKFENDKLEILKVIPEGKSEMSFEDFLRGVK